MPRRVILVAVPNSEVLDVTGPLEVFSQASRELRRRRRRASGDAAYQLELWVPERGPVTTSCGLELGPARPLSSLRGPVDTLMVAGGIGVEAALGDRRLMAGLRRVAHQARRVTSVCTGAFLLAEAGLLDRRRVTTHWAACAALQKRYPALEVDPDPIFVHDGNTWTSAGITAGMDLALALVEEDHGRDVALMVARHMVLFLKRPGGQAQFSTRLQAQQTRSAPLAKVQEWIVDNPGDDLSVARLAQRAGMSPRHFARVFTRETGTTPARFVERARVELARRLLEEGSEGVDRIAADCGFGSPETLRRSFLRTLRVGPSEYRHRFQAAGPAPEEKIA